MSIEYLDVIDECGIPTGEIVERSEAHLRGVPHRTSHVWILRNRDDNVEILLQKRAENKSFPGCYDISSAGHIPAGDNYIESALRELNEELSVIANEEDLVCCGDRYITWDDEFFGKPYHDRQYTRVFLMWLDMEEDEFVLQEEEVQSVMWMDLDQCLYGVRDDSFENCIELRELIMVKNTATAETEGLKKYKGTAVVTVDQMRRSDAYTIEHYVSGRELMYRAAYGVFQAYAAWSGKSIAILVGGGNNGGDGYALAGILMENGIPSTIYKVSEKLSEDGRYYHDIARELGVQITDFGSETDLGQFDIIVDCILGTGFKGEVRGKAGEAIRAINTSGAYIISVDINSGMNGDTGEAALAVKSDLTVSIGFYKQGFFRGDAEKYIGSLTNVDIGIVLEPEECCAMR